MDFTEAHVQRAEIKSYTGKITSALLLLLPPSLRPLAQIFYLNKAMNLKAIYLCFVDMCVINHYPAGIESD